MSIIKELADGYEGMMEVEEPRAAIGKRILITDWATRKTDAPEQNSEFPGNAALKLTRRSFYGYGLTGTGFPADYQYAKVILEYTNTALESDGESIASSEFSAEVLGFGGGIWETDGLPCDSPNTVFFGLEELCIERATTVIPEEAIRACMNKINKYAWTPPGRIVPCEPETLLFLGCSSRTQFDAITGIRHYLTYKFQRRQVSWNWFIRSDTGLWDKRIPWAYMLEDFHHLGLG